MNEIDRLIPLREAIQLAGMRTTKAYQQIAKGQLAIVHNGRRTFVKASEVQRYIEGLPSSQSQAREVS